MLQRKTIFITGGSGLLAVNWALLIRDEYHVILGLHEKKISLSGVRTVQVDLGSSSALVELFEKLKPDIIIHTAGLTSVEVCEANPLLAHHVNIELAFNVAKACSVVGISLVHISTDHLFDGCKAKVHESESISALNVYGATKASAELLVCEVLPSTLIIRTNFYAWGTTYRHSFSDMIIKNLQDGKEITLFVDVFYTPILAETLIRAVHALLDKEAKGIFHVTSDDRISKYDFGKMIADAFKLDHRLIKQGNMSDQKELVQRPFDMSLSNDKATSLIGRPIGKVANDILRLRHQQKSGFNMEILQL